MEITLLEDPACSWCWAFQPVITALEFEVLRAPLKRPIRLKRVMGGLSDRPVIEGSFFARHWMSAAELSGMPFNPDIWSRHLLRTTYEACRAVKAAQALGPPAADRLLRRIRESFHVDGIPVDDREGLIELAREEGLDVDVIREQLASGRAEQLFDRDRREVAPYRFGFPTLLIRKNPSDPPAILHGMVQYGEVLQVLHRLGFSMETRRTFVDRPEHWDELFSIHRRLTGAEIRMVTGLDDPQLSEALDRHAVQDGPYFLPRRPPRAAHSAPEPRERSMAEPAPPADDGQEMPVRGYYRIDPS
jgi:putative protein-disulfide isomerase